MRDPFTSALRSVSHVSPKQWLTLLLPVSLLCLLALLVYSSHERSQLRLTLEMVSSEQSTAQLYFDTGKGFSERQSVTTKVFTGARPQTLSFRLPAAKIWQLRFDPLTAAGTCSIRNVRIQYGSKLLLKVAPSDILPLRQIANRDQRGEAVFFSTIPYASDPGIVFRLHQKLNLKRVLFLAVAWFFTKVIALLLMVGLCAVPWSNQIAEAIHSVPAQAKCIAALCVLPWLAYLPVWLMGISTNPMLFMLSLAIQSHGSILQGGASVDPNSGFTTQALGMLSAQDWLHGIVPWWNPYTGVGLPLAAEMQTSSFFLPFVFLLRAPEGVEFLKIVLQIVAGISTYLLLRKLGVGHFASSLGALLYEFNGAFAWISHAPIAPIPFLPLLLLGIERAFEFAEQKRPAGWALVALAVAYSLYAGFPETAYLDGLLAALWTITRFTIAVPSARLAFSRKVIGGAIAGVFLALPLIVPFLEYQRLSAIGHQINAGHLPKSGLASDLFPYLYGPIGTFADFDSSGDLQNIWGTAGGYLGLTAVFFVILSLVRGKTYRRLRWTLALWIAIFTARTFGFPGTIWIFHFIPAMDLTQIHRYSQPSCELAAVILLAFALNDWLENKISFAQVVLSLAITVVFAGWAVWLGSGLIATLLRHAPGYLPWLRFSLAWSSVVLLLTAMLLSRPANCGYSLLLAVFLSLDAVVLFSVPTLSGLRDPYVDLAPVRFLQHHLGIERVYTLGPIRPNYSAYFGFASINHNAVPVSREWVQYIKTALDPGVADPVFVGNFPGPPTDRYQALRDHLAAFESIAVKYVIAHRSAFPFDSGNPTSPRLVYQDDYSNIFELPHPAPYFETKGAPCVLSVESREAVRASCHGPASLIRRELFYPGWGAFVNGRHQAPTRVASIFQKVELPPGNSQIVFRYRPSYFYWTFAAALLALLAILRPVRYGRRTKGEQL